MELAGFNAFIFDLDGTLLDSGKFHARAFAHAVKEQSGYSLTSGELVEFFASHSIPFARVLNNRHKLSLEPERVLGEKRRRMAEIFVAELFEGAREVLERWHGVKPLALATNSPEDFTMIALEKAEIRDLFTCIITADDVENRKPAPDIFNLTVQRLGVAPSSALAFEDQLVGIEAARVAGVQVAAIDNGQPVDFPPDVHVTTWKDLLAE
jgi:HAD superfamily hydrolase (TIGR01509 family)